MENQSAWESHAVKRLNLYQRHLGIPASLLRNRAVLEIGPNSGENALVLAALGADLTLIEPNEQVLPKLRSLFQKFGLQDRIVELLQDDIQSFNPRTSYDVVIVEGFLYTLPNKEEMLAKILGFLSPGGLAVISFCDRYGSLLEMTRRMVLWRACQLAGVKDMHSEESLALARKLYTKDWDRLNTSRSLEVWWKDNLVSPLFTAAELWSYAEILPLAEDVGCEYYSSSPVWANLDHFSWYKNVSSGVERSKLLLNQWARVFPYFLTGLSAQRREFEPAIPSVIGAVEGLVSSLSAYTELDGTGNRRGPMDAVAYPQALDEYLLASGKVDLMEFNVSLKRLYDVAASGDLDDLIREHHGGAIGAYWGAAYHYLCLSKELTVRPMPPTDGPG